jgi:hypothetical protein
MSNEPDEVNSGALATAIILVALATVAVATVVEALVRTTLKEVSVEKDQTQERAFRHMKSEQLGLLNAAPAWRDRAAGLVSVPIAQAMQIVLTDIRSNPYALSPGYKPPEDKPKCSEQESCVACSEGETCEEGACPAGQKCAVAATPCPPEGPCPETPADGAVAPEGATPAGTEDGKSAPPASPTAPAGTGAAAAPAPKAPAAPPTEPTFTPSPAPSVAAP